MRQQPAVRPPGPQQPPRRGRQRPAARARSGQLSDVPGTDRFRIRGVPALGAPALTVHLPGLSLPLTFPDVPSPTAVSPYGITFS
ncbi:hypothetical protein T261_7406 [Streptomyces lydicus]|nr:hypothetical protein T261_7406 [Streptomyces lydicus]